MIRRTPQTQLWSYLDSYEQKVFFGQQLRHLKRDAQEALCIALVAYIRYHIHNPFEDDWMEERFMAMSTYLDNQTMYNTIKS